MAEFGSHGHNELQRPSPSTSLGDSRSAKTSERNLQGLVHTPWRCPHNTWLELGSDSQEAELRKKCDDYRPFEDDGYTIT